MEYALELKNGEVCLYLLKNGRKMGDVSFTWEQAEWLYRQIGQFVIDFKNIHKTDVSKREEQIDRAGIDWFYKTKQQEADVAEAFMAGAKWADAHPHWISVEDELPKDSCYILVTSRGIVHHWRYGVLESADVLKNMYGITHWMPLPQAPKGGEE